MLMPSKITSYLTQADRRLVQNVQVVLLILQNIKTRLNLRINNTTLNMYTHVKLLGLILDPKLTYNKYLSPLPMLFNLSINDLASYINNEYCGVKEGNTIMLVYCCVQMVLNCSQSLLVSFSNF